MFIRYVNVRNKLNYNYMCQIKLDLNYNFLDILPCTKVKIVNLKFDLLKSEKVGVYIINISVPTLNNINNSPTNLISF
jgi:hypothetical protein